MRGGMGIDLAHLDKDHLDYLQKRLTLTQQSFNEDDPPVIVQPFRVAEERFWIPRYFDWVDFWPKISNAGWEWVCPYLDYDLESRFVPREEDRQIEALEAIEAHLRNYSGGIAVLPTGVGKTFLSLEIGRRFQTPIVILVHKGDMIDNWVEHAESHLGVPPSDVEIVKASNIVGGKPVTICSIQTLLSRDFPDEFYAQFGFVIADECITGDALIETNLGLIKLEDIPKSGAKQVLCYDEQQEQWKYRKIRRWIPQGTRKTLTVRAGKLSVRCTTNHPFLTQRGWVEAKDLLVGDRVYSPVSVDAEERSLLQTPEDAHADFLGGTTSRQHSVSTGMQELHASTKVHRCARVDVESNCECAETLRPPGSKTTSGRISSSDTVAPSVRGAHSLKKHWDYASVHCSETPGSQRTTEFEQTRASSSIMDLNKRSGVGTRRENLLVSTSLLLSGQTKDMAKPLPVVTAPAIPPYERSSTLSVAPKLSPSNGYQLFPMMVGPGGIWMTDHVRVAEFDSTQRVSLNKRLTLSQPSLVKNLVSIQQLSGPRKSIGQFDYGLEIPSNGSERVATRHDQAAWITSFHRITSIDEDRGPGEPVFDLEIEDHHNFVANGLLVHNCHHYGASQWSKVVDRFPARYRLGVSANPIRDDGLDPIIRWSFGKVAFGIYKPMSKQLPLICLMRWPSSYKKSRYHDWKKDPYGNWFMGRVNAMKYAKVLMGDTRRNSWLVDKIITARSGGRKILIFTKHRDHLELLHDEFVARWTRAMLDSGGDPKATKVSKLWGGLKPKERKLAMKADVTFTTYGFSKEATNLPQKDTLVLGTPAGDTLQTVGRLRDKGEKNRKPFLVIDPFEGNDYSFKKAMQRCEAYRNLGIKVKRYGPK